MHEIHITLKCNGSNHILLQFFNRKAVWFRSCTCNMHVEFDCIIRDAQQITLLNLAFSPHIRDEYVAQLQWISKVRWRNSLISKLNTPNKNYATNAENENCRRTHTHALRPHRISKCDINPFCVWRVCVCRYLFRILSLSNKSDRLWCVWRLADDSGKVLNLWNKYLLTASFKLHFFSSILLTFRFIPWPAVLCLYIPFVQIALQLLCPRP